MKKIFGNINFTWKKVIIFACFSAIYTALINQVPFLKNTSFQDIAIAFEVWIFFAIIIMINTKSPLDSALKTFVFFLISQPLIYLIEVPFLGFSILSYYKNWIIWTILTFPMAYIGYYLKKGNTFSLIILTPAILFLDYLGLNYLKTTIYNFPYHLLSCLFCFSLIHTLIIYIIKNKKIKYLGLIISTILIIISGIYVIKNPMHYETTIKYSDEEIYFDDNYEIYFEGKNLGKIYIDYELDDYCIKGDFKKAGKTTLVLKDKDNNKRYFNLEVNNSSFKFKEINN